MMWRISPRTFLSFAFLVFIICLVTLPVLGLQNNKSIPSYGTVNYPIVPAPPPQALPLTGIGEDYLLWGGSWPDLIPKLKYWNFNTVRLAFSFPDSPPNIDTGRTAHSKYDSTKMNDVLNILSSNGVKAILDLHNYVDMYGYFGSDAWINNWVNLARTYKGDKRIVAFEIFNEPYKGTHKYATQAEVHRACARCIDAIRAIDPDRTIVYPPFSIFTIDWGSFSIPADAIRPNIIYSQHAWTTTKDVTTAKNHANGVVNSMVNWKKTYGSMWLGEFGVNQDPTLTDPASISLAAQKEYCRALIDGCVDNSIGFCWWMYRSQQNWADAVLAESKYAQLITSPPPVSLPFRDDFIQDLSKWKILKGTWKLTNGVLDGVSTGEGLIYAGNSAWTDYHLRTRVKIAPDSTYPEAAFVVRFKDSGNFYWLGLGCWRHRVSISRMVSGTPQELVYAGAESEVVRDRWYNLEVVVKGDLLQLYVDGVLELETRDSTHPTGAIGIRPWSSHVQVDYVEAYM